MSSGARLRRLSGMDAGGDVGCWCCCAGREGIPYYCYCCCGWDSQRRLVIVQLLRRWWASVYRPDGDGGMSQTSCGHSDTEVLLRTACRDGQRLDLPPGVFLPKRARSLLD